MKIELTAADLTEIGGADWFNSPGQGVWLEKVGFFIAPHEFMPELIRLARLGLGAEKNQEAKEGAKSRRVTK